MDYLLAWGVGEIIGGAEKFRVWKWGIIRVWRVLQGGFALNMKSTKTQCKTVYDQYTYQRWIIQSWSVENNLKVDFLSKRPANTVL